MKTKIVNRAVVYGTERKWGARYNGSRYCVAINFNKVWLQEKTFMYLVRMLWHWKFGGDGGWFRQEDIDEISPRSTFHGCIDKLRQQINGQLPPDTRWDVVHWNKNLGQYKVILFPDATVEFDLNKLRMFYDCRMYDLFAGMEIPEGELTI